MKKGCLIAAVGVVVLLLVSALFLFMMYRNTYNSLVGLDENVKAKTGNVQAQYQRRADLIPNLVEVVKGYAGHEKETLTAVIQARAEATRMTLNVQDAEAMARYQNAQGSLTQALGRLMMVTEKYPDLKANENFRDLQAQLEGTENRIKQARLDYNEAVQTYNTEVRGFFTSMFFSGKFPVRQPFQADAGAQNAPKVKF